MTSFSLSHAPPTRSCEDKRFPIQLPEGLAEDITEFEKDVGRFLSGDLPSDHFKAKRVPRGMYEQRRNGTYMMRVRLPGGVLTTEQAAALARICKRHAGDQVHVTTRQDIQFHDIDIEETPGIMRELLAVGLTCNGGGGNTVRNVAACPHAGVCPFETFDVTSHALSTTEYLISLPGSYNLPRKFKIAFSGCGADCAFAEVNDVGFLAKVREGKPGFVLYAGGGMGAESRLADRLSEWIPAEEAIWAAEALRRVFAEVGDSRNRKKARLRFAVERMGVSAFREKFEREWAKVREEEEVPMCPTSEIFREDMESPQPPEAAMVVKGGLRVLPQRQAGYVSVPLAPPMGLLAGEDLGALAELAGRFSATGELRAVANQRLVMRFVRESDLPALHQALRELKADLITHRPQEAFVACAGAATCRLGLCLSRQAASKCAEALAEEHELEWEVAKHLDVRISGCPNSCGQHPIGTVGLSGVADRVNGRLVPAYEVHLGARRGEGRTRFGQTVGVIPARALPEYMLALIGDFTEHRLPEEGFPEYFDRKGVAYFEGEARPFASVPAHEEQPSFYRDLGEEEEFSLAGRGPGECGAGVFEIVAGDLEAAHRALAEAEGEPEKLYEAILAASRALLITRGVESHDPATVMEEFQMRFVRSGLVFAEAWYVVDAAREYLATREHAAGGGREAGEELIGRLIWEASAMRELLEVAEDARRLVERVEFLFTRLDSNLQFLVPEAAPVEQEVAQGAAGEAGELDLRGVGCPVNFIRARLHLETLPPGTVLRLLLDDGRPVENVPVTLGKEGYEVLQILREAEGHWRVDVRKPTAHSSPGSQG